MASQGAVLADQQADRLVDEMRRLCALFCFTVACSACADRPKPQPPDPAAAPPTTSLVRAPRRCAVPTVELESDVSKDAARECHALPLTPLAAEIAATLKQRVHAQDPQLQVEVAFDCSPVSEDAIELTGLRAYEHGDSLTLLRLQRTAAGTLELRAVRLNVEAKLDLQGSATAPQFVEQTIEPSLAQRLFATARYALAAKVHAALPPANAYTVRAPAITGGDALPITELQLLDSQNHRARLSFQGAAAESPGSSARLPLEIVWEGIAPIIAGRFVTRAVTAEDQQLLAQLWLADASHSQVIESRLLELAAKLGSARILARIVPALDAMREATRIRAVNALAASTGWDARRDAAGNLRDLAAVVADYKRECR
jgi:hypothetical protein